MDNLPYIVFALDGGSVLQAAESCRYRKDIELDLLEHGYTITLHGRKLTRKDVRNGK